MSNTLAALPPAPIVETWLFERAWFTAAAVAVFALAVGAMLNRQGRALPALVAGSIGIAIAISIGMIGQFTTTTRELIARSTRGFVAAVLDADTASTKQVPGATGQSDVSVFLADSIVLNAADRSSPPITRDMFLGLVRYARSLGIRDYAYSLEGAVAESPTVAKSDFFVRVTSSQGVVPSVWRLTWRKQPDDSWRIVTLELRSVYGEAPGAEWLRHMQSEAR